MEEGSPQGCALPFIYGCFKKKLKKIKKKLKKICFYKKPLYICCIKVI
jgi:hypothetical protein